ncbi:MAG: NAD(P)/FAD-dependent oxidoreductase [Acidobacteriota bacterium]|nr:NAD(P)/FAD-dependent oxidoreductase [Acidobacteriota bacterium]
MSSHESPVFERHCDVAVVGGSAAGLAAALQLGRQRRSVIVVDSGEARNAPAAHVHGYLGLEGVTPATLTGTGRDEVRHYGVEVLAGRVTRVTRVNEAGAGAGAEAGTGAEGDPGPGPGALFRVELTGGHSIVARRVVAATGLRDELPDIPGLAEHWGRDVLHCPFCHGFEVRDRRVVQIVARPSDLHASELWRHLTSRLTIIVADEARADEASAAGTPADEAPADKASAAGARVEGAATDVLRAGGVTVLDEPPARIVAGADGRVAAVELAGGGRVEADAVVFAPRLAPRIEAFGELGVETVPHPSGLGDVVVTDATGATSVPGVYAAGSLTDPGLPVVGASAHGSWVGASVSFSLAHEDLLGAARLGAARPSAQARDWDHRYQGAQIWSGRPNGSLVHEMSGSSPGRALDVGAGEGGDALWLAEQGWRVTASDISERGLDRVRAEAARRGLAVECLRADANGSEPFEAGAYDLVSAHYASIPRTPDARGVHNLIGAVAPGGVLLIVTHDPEAMSAPADTHSHTMPFDRDAYVRTDDFAEAVSGAGGWEIEHHERRPRPHGAVSTHHVHDVVFRARRQATPAQ